MYVCVYTLRNKLTITKCNSFSLSSTYFFSNYHLATSFTFMSTSS